MAYENFTKHCDVLLKTLGHFAEKTMVFRSSGRLITRCLQHNSCSFKIFLFRTY